MLILPVLKKQVNKGEAPQITTAQGNHGFESTNQWKSGAEVWVQTPNGPTEPAEILATGERPHSD